MGRKVLKGKKGKVIQKNTTGGRRMIGNTSTNKTGLRLSGNVGQRVT
ncbi:MAG: hypothetical protein AB2793_06320 [Candidatus Thiodiazotropha sp.]